MGDCHSSDPGSNPGPGAFLYGLDENFKSGKESEKYRAICTPAEGQTTSGAAKESQLSSNNTEEQLFIRIENLTADLSRTYLKKRLRVLARDPQGQKNASLICDYITAELNEINIKPSTKEDKIKTLLWLSEFHANKPFTDMTKGDILSYLNHLRRSSEEDPTQRWIGSYNGRKMIFNKFFRWLYNPNEPDQKSRITPPCMVGIRQLSKKEKSPYKPSDLWDSREHEIFLKYCPSIRDRCYHAMAIDMSARPHELLNLRLKDIVFKKSSEGIVYGEVLIRGGKTQPRTLPLIDCIPYVKEWLQQHPTGSNQDSWLFPSSAHQSFGQKLDRAGLWARYHKYYRGSYFPKLLDDDNISPQDKTAIRNMLTKPWNPYLFRHGSLTEKSQILTESTLRDHAGWTYTSRMPGIYLHYFGTESSRKLLEARGIVRLEDKGPASLRTKQCPNCDEPNKQGARFCASCKIILKYDEYQSTAAEKDKMIRQLQAENALTRDAITNLSDLVMKLSQEVSVLQKRN